MLFQDPGNFLAEVEAIARIGGQQLMTHWRNLKPGQVDEKARNDFVSVADYASEKAIIDAVAERFPDHRVLSEEAGWSGRARSGPTWIVDPLDGTTNFVQGIPQFAVSIGVAVDDRVDYGVIFDPCRNDVFSAARGCGANWNGTACHVSDRQGLEGSLIATGFPFKAHRLLDPYLAIFRDVFLGCKAIRRPWRCRPRPRLRRVRALRRLFRVPALPVGRGRRFDHCGRGGWRDHAPWMAGPTFWTAEMSCAGPKGSTGNSSRWSRRMRRRGAGPSTNPPDARCLRVGNQGKKCCASLSNYCQSPLPSYTQLRDGS